MGNVSGEEAIELDVVAESMDGKKLLVGEWLIKQVWYEDAVNQKWVSIVAIALKYVNIREYGFKHPIK